MRKTLVVPVALFAILIGLATNGDAVEKATKEECVAKCKEAVELFQQVGSEKAIQQMNLPDSDFTWKDSYVFVFETQEAKLLSHPAQRLIGWSMLEFRSADNIMIFQEIIKKLDKADHGWISYQVLIDQKPPPIQKTTYYEKIPGENLVVAAGYYDGAKSSTGQKTEASASAGSLKIEEFVKIEGLLHGIVFDGKGHMFVGKNGKEILKVFPNGNVELFCEIKEADGYFIDGPGNTFLYDMVVDGQGNLYAAVEDRILKVSSEGEITTLLKKEFTGNWGVCGIALDQNSNIFYAYDDKIMKLTKDGETMLFFDGGQASPPVSAVVGIEFAPDYDSLFACDGKLGAGKLVKIPIRSDGDAGQIELIYSDEKTNMEYIAFDKDSKFILKGPWSASFVRVDKNGKAESLNHASIGFGIQTIALGGKGFDQNAIFGTQMPVGVVYKIILP